MEKGFYAFGTINFICIGSPMSEKAGREILDDMQAVCSELDDMLSVFKPYSEISRINAAAGKEPVPVNQTVFELLRRAKEIYKLSEGAFDITVGPAVKLWNIGHQGQRVPYEGELKRVRRLVNSNLLILDEDNCTAYLEKRGQSVDLGGIAKGYAGDVVRSRLLNKGIDSALLNFGGTILTIGKKPDGSPWRIGIQNPIKERGVSVGTIMLENSALVTSGVNERFFISRGIRYHHLLDPRTCAPARSGVLSVTAAGECAMDLDALTTALFVLGVEKGMELAAKTEIDALYLTENGCMFGTCGFVEGKYKFTPSMAITA